MNNRLQKNNKIVKTTIKVLCGALCVASFVAYHRYEINQVKQQKDVEIVELQKELSLKENDVMAYKIMYNSVSKKINGYKQERDEAITKYNDIEEQIKYSKLTYGTPNRGDFGVKKLTEYPIVTIDEMNEYIESVAPSDSPFIGKGETFLKASHITNLDPYYIFAHASVESGYGNSNIAVTKHNYFGIASFNYDPNNAYHMGNNLDEGIIQGALWIKKNYTNKGYDTLTKMVYDGSYCLTDSGEPSQKWIDDISYIATIK